MSQDKSRKYSEFVLFYINEKERKTGKPWALSFVQIQQNWDELVTHWYSLICIFPWIRFCLTKLVLLSWMTGKVVNWVLNDSSALFRTSGVWIEICLSKLYVRTREWNLPDQYSRDGSVLHCKFCKFCKLQVFKEIYAEKTCISKGRLSRNMLNCSGTLLTGTPNTEWSFEAFSSLQSARNDNSCGLQFVLDQSLRKNMMPLSVCNLGDNLWPLQLQSCNPTIAGISYEVFVIRA